MEQMFNLIQRKSYILEAEPKLMGRKVTVYTQPIPGLDEEGMVRILSGRGIWAEHFIDGGLLCSPLGAFFSAYPKNEKVKTEFFSLAKIAGEPYDAKKINALEQALYIPMLGDSIAMPMFVFPIVGIEAITKLMEERNATPKDMDNLSTHYCNVISSYDTPLGSISVPFGFYITDLISRRS